MHNILLVRHGESEQNNRILSDRYMPDHEIALTENGIKQAYEAGSFLNRWLEENNIPIKSIRLWVSPFKRTRQTAEVINKQLKIKDVKEDEMLTELRFGIFHNLTKEECTREFPEEYKRFQMSRRFNGKYYARRPEGESPFDCEIRQKLFIDTIFRDFNTPGQPDNLVIIGHGAALNIFRKAMFHYSHEWYEEEPNPSNCSIMHLTLDNGYNKDCGYIYGGPMPEK